MWWVSWKYSSSVILLADGSYLLEELSMGFYIRSSADETVVNWFLTVLSKSTLLHKQLDEENQEKVMHFAVIIFE